MAAVPVLHVADAQLFAAFNAELHRTVRKCVNTSAANVEDACADACLALRVLLHVLPAMRPPQTKWWTLALRRCGGPP
jgi:hypothetical protein